MSRDREAIPRSWQLAAGWHPPHNPHTSRLHSFYIADCKLCCIDNLDHIDANDGKFITIVPKNRKNIKFFHQYIQTHNLYWQDAMVVPDSRKKGNFVTYKTFEWATAREEYSMIWVHNSSKEKQDKGSREHAVQKAQNKLADLSKKLSKHKLKTRNQIKAATKKSCKGTAELFDINLIEEKQIVRKQSTP